MENKNRESGLIICRYLLYYIIIASVFYSNTKIIKYLNKYHLYNFAAAHICDKRPSYTNQGTPGMGMP